MGTVTLKKMQADHAKTLEKVAKLEKLAACETTLMADSQDAIKMLTFFKRRGMWEEDIIKLAQSKNVSARRLARESW